MISPIFNLSTNEYELNEEFDNQCNILRAKIGKQLIRFANKFRDELGVNVDKSCFNIAAVCALPVTKNYKYNGFTWRGVISIVNKGENVGLTDYILSGVVPLTHTSVFAKSRKQDIADRLVGGKLREHLLVQFMLQPLPIGDRNNKLFFQFKCLVRDSGIDMRSEEFRLLHKELEKLWNDSLPLNVPDKKFSFARDIVNSYCVEHFLPPIYQPLWENRIAKRPTMLTKAVFDDIIKENYPPLFFTGGTIDEDMRLFNEVLIDNDYHNVNKYGSFLKGCIERYGIEKTRYYSQWVFPRQFCWQ
jgi:hypothetical protein